MPQTPHTTNPAENASASEPVKPAVEAEQGIRAAEEMDCIQQLARLVFAAGCVA